MLVYDPQAMAMEDIRKELEPKSERILPLFRQTLAMEKLQTLSIERLQAMCRRLQTNIDGLMDKLEKAGIIPQDLTTKDTKIAKAKIHSDAERQETNQISIRI
ncbi:MAG: hypothetical protein LLF76_02360 [Planctomycetaceae bacterium]|nr:hypothetical protein [Planctomycetaceae bacterium]